MARRGISLLLSAGPCHGGTVVMPVADPQETEETDDAIFVADRPHLRRHWGRIGPRGYPAVGLRRSRNGASLWVLALVGREAAFLSEGRRRVAVALAFHGVFGLPIAAAHRTLLA
jgi:hypothetical protein